MIPLTTTWTNLKDTNLQLFYLVEIPALGIFLSSRLLQNPAAWKWDEGLRWGEFVLWSWTHLDAQKGRFTGRWKWDEGLKWGDELRWSDEHSQDLYQVAHGLDTLSVSVSEGSGIVRVSNVTVRVSNLNGFGHGLWVRLQAPWNKRCVIRAGTPGVGYQEFLTVFTGVIDDIQITPEDVIFVLTGKRFMQDRLLNFALTDEYFPGTPAQYQGRSVPLLMGRLYDVETIPISGGVTGTLAFSMTSTQTHLLLTEAEAAFPATGTVTIESETGITYTNRQQITYLGVTYLYLSGLTRGGAPATHAAGQTVTLTTVQYQYLLGHEVNSVDVVRNNGTPTSSYTLVRSSQRGTRRVSYLEFTGAQGTVTADINGVAFAQGNKLTNPGFGAGNTTGWTLESGGTATVDATPTPQDGSFQLDLTGAVNSYRALYQDVEVQTGVLHSVALYHQTQQATLGTNLGFEVGSFAGWTFTGLPSGQQGSSVVQAPPGQEATLCKDGSYRAEFQKPNNSETYNGIFFYQDIAVSNATEYVFSFWYQLTALYSGSSQVPSRRGSLYYNLGTDANPTLYANRVAMSPTLTYDGSGNQVDYGYQQLSPLLFTTQSTTLRISFEILTSYPYGWVARLDALSVQLGSGQDTSMAGLQIGTPSIPGAYIEADLPLAYNWYRTEWQFTPTDSPVRLSLRAKYTGTSTPAHFDSTSLVQNSATTESSAPMDPGAAIAWWIDTLLPNAKRNVASFTNVSTILNTTKISGYVASPGNAEEFLALLAEHASCWLVENYLSELTLILKPLPGGGTPGYTLSRTTNIIAIAMQTAPSETLYTHYSIRYGQRTRGVGGTGDNALGTVYCNPTATSHPLGATLTNLCTAAEVLGVREHTFTAVMPYLHDLESAHEYLRRKVRYHTTRWQDLRITTRFETIHLEIGDHVLVEDPLCPYISGQAVCWVREKIVDLANTQITLIVRTLREG